MQPNWLSRVKTPEFRICKEDKVRGDYNTGMDYPKIAQEIIDMAETDQEIRKGSQIRNRKFDKNIDIKNTKRLKQIINKLGGWPTINLVGEEAAYAAWLIVQHADHDVEFQEKCLALMLKNKEGVLLSNIAYLTDRVAINQGKMQTYGTQFGINDEGKLAAKPIRNLNYLEKRRKEIGLETFVIYEEKMKGEYKWLEGYENPKVGRFDKSS